MAHGHNNTFVNICSHTSFLVQACTLYFTIDFLRLYNTLSLDRDFQSFFCFKENRLTRSYAIYSNAVVMMEKEELDDFKFL